MTEQNSNSTPETDVPETELVVEPNFVQKFVIKHPRLAKATAIIGGTLAIGGTALTVNTMRKNKHHLDAAADDAKGALYEIGQSVSPDPETDA